MNRTVKISLGRVAFTVNEDAHELLKHYLEKLTAHYSSHANGQEIVDGIEEHIAALLLDRNYRDRIVDITVIQEVIQRMGEPADIDRDSGVEEPRPVRKKRIYRNLQRRFLGGVCGGLSVFLNLDVVLIRLIFVGLAILGFILSVEDQGDAWFSLMPLLYLILWAIVPSARTFEQRCEMNGVSPGIPNVEKQVENGENPLQTTRDNTQLLSRLARLFCRISGFCLLLCGFSILSGIAITYISLQTYGLPLHQLCQSFGIASGEILFLISFACWGLLFFYWGTLLVFVLKPLRWKPGLWLFLVSVICGIGGVLNIGSAVIPWVNPKQETSNKIVLDSKTCDTLFVVLEDYPNDFFEKEIYHMEANQYSLECAYFEQEETNSHLVIYPEIHFLTREKQDIEVVEHCEFTRQTNPQFLFQEPNHTFHARTSGDTLYVKPFRIGNLKETTIIGSTLNLSAPKQTVLHLVHPLEHTFRNPDSHRIEVGTLDW